MITGRKVVLTSKLGEDTWLAQHLEAALKPGGSYDHLVVHNAELKMLNRGKVRIFHSGDQLTLASGRKIVLVNLMVGGSWRAQYMEDAEKKNQIFVVVKDEELRRAKE